MERNQGAAVRPSRASSHHKRPRLAVMPRTYMDVMTPGVQSQTVRPVATRGIAEAKPQQLDRAPFEMKPIKAPSKVVQHSAPTVRPAARLKLEPAPALEHKETIPELALLDDTEPTTTTHPSPVEVERTVTKQNTPTVEKRKAKPRGQRKVSLKRRILRGMTALLFLAGVGVSVDGWFANRSAETTVSALGSQVSGNTGTASSSESLSEKRPDRLGGYSVATELPRIIHIPSLAVVARTMHLGVQADNTLDAPRNIYDAGWYKASARPADASGAILIDGHVTGPTKPGVFSGLKKLKGGEEIVIERGDRQMTTFVVKRVETVKASQVDMAKLLDSVEPDKLGLNLITCGGEFDSATNSYKSRVIVYAVKK